MTGERITVRVQRYRAGAAAVAALEQLHARQLERLGKVALERRRRINRITLAVLAAGLLAIAAVLLAGAGRPAGRHQVDPVPRGGWHEQHDHGERWGWHPVFGAYLMDDPAAEHRAGEHDEHPDPECCDACALSFRG